MSLGLGLTKPAAVSLPQRIRSILNKYPAGDAHLFIPGAAIPVLGPERVTNGDFSKGTDGAEGWTLGAGWEVSNNVLTHASTALEYATFGLPGDYPTGSAYRVEFDYTYGSGSVTGYIRGQSFDIPSPTISGKKSITVVAGSSSLTGFHLSASTADATFDNISVREILSYTDRISNFGAGNYFDTIGTTGATVDQTVGRVNDAANGLGPELVSNGDFADGLTGWTPYFTEGTGAVTLSGGGVAISSTDGTYTALSRVIYPSVIGKTYRVSLDISGIVGSGLALVYGGVQTTLNVTRRYSFIVVATSVTSILEIKRLSGVCGGTVDNISIKEVIGIHATQSTTANMPTLRKGAVNLLTYSQDMSHAVWGKTTISLVRDSVFVTTGEVGVQSWKLGETAVSGSFATSHALTTVAAGTGITCSVYMKAAERRYGYLQVNDGTSSNACRAVFDLVTGTITSPASIVLGAFTNLASSIVPVGNEWYRVSMSATLSAVANMQLYVGMRAESGVAAYAGILGSGIYVGGAQIELGSVVTPHAPTAALPASNGVGNYAWGFDGTTDYLKLDAPLFSMADDHCVIAGVRCSYAASAQAVFSMANLTNSAPLFELGYISTALVRFVTRDDASTLDISSGAVSQGAPVVLTGIRQDFKGVTNKRLRANGVILQASTVSSAAATFNTVRIGNVEQATISKSFQGNAYPIIVIKGTVSDADLLTLERWVGRMSGVQL